MAEDWTSENPSLGQCSITAFLVQDIFGGEVYGVDLKDGNYHCFNVIDGHIYDLTSAQFDHLLDYTLEHKQEREVHFQKKEKEERYQKLKKSLAKKEKEKKKAKAPRQRKKLQMPQIGGMRLLLGKKGEIQKKIRLDKSNPECINAVTGEKCTALVNKGEKDKVSTKVEIKERICAPVKKGDKLGEIEIYIDGVKSGQCDLVAEKSAEKASVKEIYMRMFKSI